MTLIMSPAPLLVYCFDLQVSLGGIEFWQAWVKEKKLLISLHIQSNNYPVHIISLWNLTSLWLPAAQLHLYKAQILCDTMLEYSLFYDAKYKLTTIKPHNYLLHFPSIKFAISFMWLFQVRLKRDYLDKLGSASNKNSKVKLFSILHCSMILYIKLELIITH